MKKALPILTALAALMALRAGAQAPMPTPGWQFSSQVDQGYSSNVQGALQNPEADATTSVTLQLGRNWITPRSRFSLSYVPQGMNYARHTSLDYIAQSLQQNWQYTATRHTSLSWNSAFEQFPERGGQAQIGAPSLTGLQGASQAQEAGTLLTRGESGFGLQHQASLRSSWSAGLSGTWMGFRQDRALNPQLPAISSSQTRSLDARLGWDYRLTPGGSVGLSVAEGEIWFTQPVQHTRSVSLQATASQRWGGTTLQVGAGPAWNWEVFHTGLTSSLPPHSWSANSSLLQQIGEMQLGLTWAHQVQASLAPGSLSTDNLALQVQQQWGRWNAGASLGNTRLAAVAAGPARTGLFAAAQLGYTLTHWDLEANCNYNSQDMAAGLGQLLPYRRLQTSLGVRYSWQGAH